MQSGGGCGSVAWPEMAAIEISANAATGAKNEAQSAEVLASARGAKGYYHMRVIGAGAELSLLYLHVVHLKRLLAAATTAAAGCWLWTACFWLCRPGLRRPLATRPICER